MVKDGWGLFRMVGDGSGWVWMARDRWGWFEIGVDGQG